MAHHANPGIYLRTSARERRLVLISGLFLRPPVHVARLMAHVALTPTRNLSWVSGAACRGVLWIQTRVRQESGGLAILGFGFHTKFARKAIEAR